MYHISYQSASEGELWQKHSLLGNTLKKTYDIKSFLLLFTQRRFFFCIRPVIQLADIVPQAYSDIYCLLKNNINTVRLTSYFSVLCVFIFLLASFLFLFCDPLYWREGKTDNNIVKYTVIYRCSNEFEHKAEEEGFAEVLFYT